MHRRRSVVILATCLALAPAACSGSSPRPVSKGTITVGSADFPEAQIIGSAYVQALQKAGYDVKQKLKMGPRDSYVRALERGEIDVVPEYVATLTEYFNARYSGPAAPAIAPLASGDLAATYGALTRLAGRDGFVAGPPSKATDKIGFAVTKDYADKYGLSALSDLIKLNGQVVLGAGPDCPTQRTCLLGLQQVYGLRLKAVVAPGAADSDLIYAALMDDTIQLGQVQSSDGRVAQDNFVVLADDRGLENADNLTALFRKSVPAEAQAIVNKVNAAFTTEKLQELNSKVKTADPKGLAAQFLKDARLG